MSTISAEVLNDGCVRISSKPTNATRTFPREWIFSYRNVRNAKFVVWERKTIAANANAGTVTSNVGGSEQQLTPNNVYEFKVEIRNKSTGESLETKSIPARTAEATGTLTLLYNPEAEHPIRITIGDLKSDAYYDRTVLLYEYREGEEEPYNIRKFLLPAGAGGSEGTMRLLANSAVIQHGKFYGFSVAIARGAVDETNARPYKIMERQDIYAPYDDISTAEITSVTQTGQWEYEVEWEITREIEDTIENTVFTLRLHVPGSMGAGEEDYTYSCGQVVGSETTSMTVNLLEIQGNHGNASNPWMLMFPKKSQFFIEVEESNTTSRFESQRVPVTTTLLFFWTEEDKEKYVWPSENYFSRKPGDAFNITAEDWNRMAYGLWEVMQIYQSGYSNFRDIPKPYNELEYQDIVDLIFVEPGEELAAEKANRMPFGPGVEGEWRNWNVPANQNMYRDGRDLLGNDDIGYAWDIIDTKYVRDDEMGHIVADIDVEWYAPLTYHVTEKQATLDISGHTVTSQTVRLLLNFIGASQWDVVDAHTMNKFLDVINTLIMKGV